MSDRKEKNSLFITDKTIKYSGQVYQLKNITQVGKYKVKRGWVGRVIFALLIGAGGIAMAEETREDGFALVGLAVAALLLLWTIFRRSHYLLRLETSSGSAELFTSRDESFIDELIRTISDVMEEQQEGTNIIAYTDKSKIINNSTQKIVRGDEVAGDKFNKLNLTNSQFVNRSPNAVVTNQISEIYGKEVQLAIDTLARHIADRNDRNSAALLEKIKEEISTRDADRSKVAALWNSLVTILPEAGKVATAIATIAAAIL